MVSTATWHRTGTLNHEQFLWPDLGNRRFLVFVTNYIDWKYNIDKVWAQTYFLLKDGFQYWADDAENQEILERLDKFTYMSYEEEVILHFFQVPTQDTPPQKIVRMNATEIIDYLHDKTTIPLTP